MPFLTPSETVALDYAANAVGVADKKWLYDLINFESGWNPEASNPAGTAKGLIQWINKTARGMGYADSADLVKRHPTREAQLRGPIIQYLRPMAPFNSEQSLYMAVFYPMARFVPLSTTFKTLYGSNTTGYADFERGNRGILTVGDYISRLKKKPIIRLAVKGGATVAVLWLAWFALRK